MEIENTVNITQNNKKQIIMGDAEEILRHKRAVHAANQKAYRLRNKELISQKEKEYRARKKANKQIIVDTMINT